MQYLKVKSDTSFTKDVKDAINLISFNPDNVLINGSFSFKSSLYSSDIDLFEDVTINAKNKIDACKMISKKFLNKIVNGIFESKADVYLGEIKAGYYTKYYNVLKQLGEIKNNKLIGYDYNKVLKVVNDIYYSRKELNRINKEILNEAKLTKLQYGYLKKIHSKDEILPYIKKNISINEWLNLYEQIRLDSTIRWTFNDVYYGKAYYDDIKQKVVYIPLWKAIAEHEAPFKIDMIYLINNRYIEVTNFYALFYKNSNNRKQTINGIVFIMPEFILALKADIRELTQSQEKNYLKAVKRIIVFARLEKNLELLKKLVPITNSNLGLVSQVISDIKVLKELIKRASSEPIEKILNEIDFFKARLSNVYEFKFDELGINKIIDKILSHKYPSKSIIVKYITKELDNILDKLGNIINTQTIKKLKEINFYPIPLKYLS